MPFVDPQTIHNPTPLQPVSSAWGDQVRDDIVWLAGDGSTANPKPMCKVSGGALGTTSGAWQALAGITEEYDAGSMHTSSGANTRITVPAGGAGVYTLVMAVRWYVTGGGSGRLLRFRKNGSTVVSIEAFASPDTSAHGLTARAKLADGDYIEAQCYQDSGSTKTVDLVEFSAHWDGVG